MIVTPIAEVVARAASHECWVSRPARPGDRAGVADAGLAACRRCFDHLADRNLDLIRRYADDLAGPAATSFPHAAPQGEPVD